MLKGNWDKDRRPPRKWKNKQLGQRIKWTGPSTPQPPGLLYDIAPTQAEKDKHQLAWYDAGRKYLEEQLRRLPLLAQEYGIDTRNDVWVLGLLLALAAENVPGFALSKPQGRPRKWDENAQTELIANVEAVKARKRCDDAKACHVLVTSSKYQGRYRGNPRFSSEKRAHTLNTRLVEARNAKSFIARLLAGADGELKQLLTDDVIALFSCDPNDAENAKVRSDVLWKKLTDELKEAEARVGTLAETDHLAEEE